MKVHRGLFGVSSRWFSTLVQAGPGESRFEVTTRRTAASSVAAVLSLVALPSARAITCGQLLTDGEPDAFKAAVLLDVGGTGTGVHLGNGYFLTAAHNILAAMRMQGRLDRLPFVEIAERGWKNRLEIGAADYSVFLPPIQRRFSAGGGTSVANHSYPEPDVIVIKLNQSGRFGHLPVAAVADSEISTRSHLIAVGGGHVSYPHEPRQGAGTLRYGHLLFYQQDRSRQIFFTIAPLENPQYSAFGPGDSGGPVFLLGADDELTLVGVVSRNVTSYSKEGKVSGYVDAIGDLTDPDLNRWIKEVLAGNAPAVDDFKPFSGH